MSVSFNSKVDVIDVDPDTNSKIAQACDLMRDRQADHRDNSARVIQYYWWGYKFQERKERDDSQKQTQPKSYQQGSLALRSDTKHAVKP
jgi:hypothetical protein